MSNKYIDNDLDSDLDEEVDVNKENENLYNDLIENSRRNTDQYWDRNNPIIKIILLVLFIVGVIGVVYYLFVAITMK